MAFFPLMPRVRLPAITESLIRLWYLMGNGGFSPEPFVTGLLICHPFLDKCILPDLVVTICMVYSWVVERSTRCGDWYLSWFPCVQIPFLSMISFYSTTKKVRERYNKVHCHVYSEPIVFVVHFWIDVDGCIWQWRIPPWFHDSILVGRMVSSFSFSFGIVL